MCSMPDANGNVTALVNSSGVLQALGGQWGQSRGGAMGSVP